MKVKLCMLFAICLSIILLCSTVILPPDRDPALTGNEPAEGPDNIHGIFAIHYDLLAEAAEYFRHNPQVYEVTRDEWEVSSGFFASDINAAAIRKALGKDGVEIVRRLNEEAYLRSLAYYIPTEERVPALLFNFFPQGYDDSLLIYIYPANPTVDRAHKEGNTISLLSANHGVLIPLSVSRWYYTAR